MIKPTRSTIPEYFSGLALAIRNQAESLSTLSPHKGDRGDNDHEKLAQLIRKYLPIRIGVGNGHVINVRSDEAERDETLSMHRISPSMDIVLYDALENAPLGVEETYQLYPVEMCLGCIEVTRFLDAAKLEEDLKKLARVRQLGDLKCYSFAYDCDEALRRLPCAYLIGLTSSLSEDELVRQIASIDDDLRPNAVLMLDRGLYIRRAYSTDFYRVEQDTLYHFISLMRSQIENFPLGRADLSQYVDVGGMIIYGEPGSLSSSSPSPHEYEEFERGSEPPSDDHDLVAE